MRDILFTEKAFDEYNDWEKENKKHFEKVKKLIKETAKSPFDGLGKPELLKDEFKGC